VLPTVGFSPATTVEFTAAANTYGGIYIAASLLWLWLAEGQRPTATDLVGAGIAISGALLIIGFAPKMR
jgi:drug/metabolite transporter superfamily protein YnfA